MAVFLKYNGIRKPYAQEYDEIKARIAASDDADLLEEMEGHPSRDRPVAFRSFEYNRGGKIDYLHMDLEVGREEIDSSGELPVINLVPLGADDSIPYHHNMNPDDDLSLNPTLLQLLHRLMDHEYAKDFLNFDDEKREPEYYDAVRKPRCLKFIEQGLTSDPSLGYGATAFFNDMLLLFRSPERYYYRPTSWEVTHAMGLELFMKKLLREMGSVGEQLLVSQSSYSTQQLYWYFILKLE